MRTIFQGPGRWLLAGLIALVGLTLAGALFTYFTGDAHTLPVGTVPQLGSVPVTLARIAAGPDSLALQANGYFVSQTHDVGGPELWPTAAAAWLLVLAAGLVVWLAVISQLARPAFLAGASLVIFLLMSLSLDALELFGRRELALVLALVLLVGPAFALQAFFDGVSLGRRLLLFTALVAGLGALLFTQSALPREVIVLQLAAYATLPALAALVLLALWVSGELIFGLLWLNTQGATPNGRYGLLPFVLSSGLLLLTMGLYYWNGGQLAVLPGVHLEPYLLLLLAALVGWFALPRREATYRSWLPLPAAGPLYLVLVLLALGGTGYAAATANTPLLQAGRDLSNLVLLAGGAAFLLYCLLNFGPLIRERKQVYRVAYDPRRMPYYTVMILTVLATVAVLLRNDFDVLDHARAGEYVQLGDLTRLQSDQQPDNLYLAALAERYYAEADQLDPRNRRAALGRAALYQRLAQRQNEINILRSTLEREPDEKVYLRLAARYDQPGDFFDLQQLLRRALRAYPASPRLNAEMAQLYSRSALTDSVQYYYRRAVAADADNAVARTNWLAYLLKHNQLPAARQAVAEAPLPAWPAWQNNAWLTDLLQGRFQAVAATQPPVDSALTVPQFAQLYHVALAQAAQRDTAALPLLRQLRQLRSNDPYTDQLTLAVGLQMLRGGRPADGFDQLQPLTAGSTGGYYQQVLGLYLLERGLYPAAAARFAEAETAGNAAAALPATYALYWAGQPDSARSVANRAVRAVPTAAPALQRLLSGTAPHPASLARPQAAAFARAATQAPTAATAAYRRLVWADPFDEAGATQAATFFVAQKDPVSAYELLQRALRYNPQSIPLLRTLALTAADSGLDEYATEALTQLSTLLAPAEYATFRQQFEQRRAAHRTAAQPWD